MANDENIQSFTPEFFSRPQKQHSPYKWMDEDKNFFYDLFAERTNTTKTLTKKIIPTEPSGEEQEATELSQHVLKEIQTPFVTPTKELSSTPLPQRPHKPKVVMRDLNEGKKKHRLARRDKCETKNFCGTSRIKNRRWHPLHCKNKRKKSSRVSEEIRNRRRTKN